MKATLPEYIVNFFNAAGFEIIALMHMYMNYITECYPGDPRCML